MMLVRIANALAVVVVIAASAPAIAQDYRGGPYAEPGPYSRAPLPDFDDDDDLPPDPGTYHRPPPDPYGGPTSVAPSPADPGLEPYARRDEGRETLSARPGDPLYRAPTTRFDDAPRHAPQDVIESRDLRPPVEVGSRGGQTLASLPPDIRPETGEPAELPPRFKRQLVDYQTKEPPGTIVVDTANTYLYLVLGNGKAIRYGIGVGREGFTWSGRERISRMAEWPDWYPPQEMIERQPYLPRFMAGGPGNPLGARALYLGNTLYRIHGTNQPSTIGKFVSSGCIRLLNEDIIDLYQRVTVGTRVVVLPGKPPQSAAKSQ